MLYKYILEGLVVSFVTLLIKRKQFSFDEIVLIGLVASITFYIIDTFAPNLSDYVRQGTGIGIGLKLTGINNPLSLKGGELDNFESEEQLEYVKENLGLPYKIHNGNYATKIILPGYNENVKEYNEDEIEKCLEKKEFINPVDNQGIYPMPSNN